MWRATADAVAGRHDRLSQARLSRAGGGRPRFFSDAGARRRAYGREGPQSVGQLSHASATAQRAAVPRTGRRGSRLVGHGRSGAHLRAVPLHDFGDRDRRDAARAAGGGHACRTRSRAIAGRDPDRAPEGGPAAARPPRVRERQHQQHRPSAWLLRDDCELADLRDAARPDRCGLARTGGCGRV